MQIFTFHAFQVAPAEIEALLIAHPNITDAAVVGVQSAEVGELPKAFVVVSGEINEKEVVDYVDKHVAPFKKLRGGVEFIDKIPTSSSGKKLRRELKIRDLVKQQLQQETSAQNNNNIAINNQRNTSAASGKRADEKQVQVVQNAKCCTIS